MEWRAVQGFPLYEVSSCGQVRSRYRGDWRPLRPKLTSYGYHSVVLFLDGRRHGTFVHHLVLQAFVGPKEPEQQTLHANGVRTDNRVGNLSWGSAQDNADDRRKHGKTRKGDNHPFRLDPSKAARGEKNGWAKLTDEIVQKIRCDQDNGLSIAASARKHEISESAIRGIYKRKTWKHVVYRPSWDSYFMKLATVVATRSTCPRGSVGVVLVRDRHILCTGYNGSPAKAPHCLDEGCVIGETGGCTRTQHAEANALQWARDLGVDVRGSTAYVTLSPCLQCASDLVEAGVVAIYYLTEYRKAEHLRTLSIPATQIVLESKP